MIADYSKTYSVSGSELMHNGEKFRIVYSQTCAATGETTHYVERVSTIQIQSIDLEKALPDLVTQREEIPKLPYEQDSRPRGPQIPPSLRTRPRNHSYMRRNTPIIQHTHRKRHHFRHTAKWYSLRTGG